MNSITREHQDGLAEICRRFHVARLEVSGSLVTGEFGQERSDLHFFVEFEEVTDALRFDAFFGLRGALAELFGRRVDLVEDGAPRNPYFIRRMNNSRRLIYAE